MVRSNKERFSCKQLWALCQFKQYAELLGSRGKHWQFTRLYLSVARDCNKPRLHLLHRICVQCSPSLIGTCHSQCFCIVIDDIVANVHALSDPQDSQRQLEVACGAVEIAVLAIEAATNSFHFGPDVW